MQVLAPPDLSRSKRLPISCGQAWIAKCAADIPVELREAAFAGQCRDFRYYEVVEQTLGRQFEHQYLILHNEQCGEWAIQPIFFVSQDLLVGLPVRLRKVAERLRKIWPGLFTMRMMMVGCSAGLGDLDHTAEWLTPALREAILAYQDGHGASVTLFKDFAASYRECFSPLTNDGYARIPSMPCATLNLNFATFEDFMADRLSKVFRKNLRRKFKALKSAPPVTMEVVEDVSFCVDEVHQLYLQTHRRSPMKFEELTRDYFEMLGQRMPDRVRYFLWRQEGRLVAFNLCMQHDDVLYDMDLGLDYSVALDLHLYFVTWRDVIEWCLRNGVRTYHTGPLNYAPKAHLRMSLAPHDLYVSHRSTWMNPLFKLATRFLEPTRHDPNLRKFSNAHEL